MRGIVLVNHAPFSSFLWTIQRDGIGSTSTSGLTLQNTTAAANGAQQYSPSINLIGQGWKTNATAASQPVEFRAEVRPVQGAAAPTGLLTFSSRINAGSWSDLVFLGSDGMLSFGGSSSSFPGLIRNSNQLRVRLADNSNFTNLEVGTLYANLYLAFAGSTYFSAPADSQVNINDSNNSKGVGLDVSTDGLLKIRTRAQTADASISAKMVTSSGVSLDDHGTTKVGTTVIGHLTVWETSGAQVGQFSCIGTGAVAELHDSSGNFTITKDNDTTINVYYSVDGVYIQNELGSTKTIYWVLVGTGA